MAHEANSTEVQEMYPNLLVDNLSPRDITKVTIQLNNKADDIKFKFEQFLCDLITSFVNRKLLPDTLTRAFINFSGLSPISSEDRRKLMEIKSIDGIINELRDKKYISLLNYHLLENVIKYLSNDEEKKLFACYFQHFEEYCKRSVFEVPQTMFDRVPTGVKFGLKVQDDIKENFPHTARACSGVLSEDEVVTCSSEVLGLSVNSTISILGKLAEILSFDVGNFSIINATQGCTKIIVSVSRSTAEKILTEIGNNGITVASFELEKLSLIGIHTVCGPPGKPQAISTANRITLSWTKPYLSIGHITNYLIFLYPAKGQAKKWERFETSDQETSITLANDYIITIIDEEAVSFIFKVCAVSKFGEGIESEESDEITIIPSHTCAESNKVFRTMNHTQETNFSKNSELALKRGMHFYFRTLLLLAAIK